jgi:HEAT repeats
VRATVLVACSDIDWQFRLAAVTTLASQVGESTVDAAMLAALDDDDDEDVGQAAVTALEDFIVRQKFGQPWPTGG